VPVKASEPEDADVADEVVAVVTPVFVVVAVVGTVVGGMTSLPVLKEIGTGISSPTGFASSPTAITQVTPADACAAVGGHG
jgi:hypothetical protein